MVEFPSAPPRIATGTVVLGSALLLACAKPATVSRPEATNRIVQGTEAGPVFLEEEVDSPVRPIALKRPTYPPSLRGQSICGTADMTYIVGVDGVAEPASIAVTAASLPAFGAAAQDAIRGSAFAPAVRAGKPVRQRVVQRITFSIGSADGSSTPPPC